MTRQQEMVQEFHARFRLLQNDQPTMISHQEKLLREKLIEEELIEYNAADTVVEVADALGDLLYVILGAAVAHGIDLEPVFNEISRSNMTKAWTQKEIEGKLLEPGLRHYLACQPSLERPWIVKNSTGKAIKSPSYSPADLSSIISKQAVTT